jgi:hypothetical protein
VQNVAEPIAVIQGLIALGGIVLGTVLMLRFTHFKKELKELRKQMSDRSTRIDSQLNNEIKLTPPLSKGNIKALVNSLAESEQKIKELDDLSTSLVGNFKIDLAMFGVLGAILLMTMNANPIESAYIPMLLIGLGPIVDVIIFVMNIFHFTRIEREIEEEQEAERKKALSE